MTIRLGFVTVTIEHCEGANIVKKLILKKRKGASDLIASVFAIFALSVFALFFINTIGDVYTRTRVDQVARKYILRMESAGTLLSSDKTAIENELKQISAVKRAVSAGKTIKITATGGGGIDVCGTGNNAGYGNTITLKIECPAFITSWGTAKNETFGLIKRNQKVTTYVVEKQSTAKY